MLQRYGLCSLLTLFALLHLFAGPIFATGATTKARTPDPVKQALDVAIMKVKPALVRIHVVAVTFENGRETKQEGFGSGVIVTPDGYVITNHHVAGNAKYVTCTLATREEIEARLIGTDALSDLCVLRLSPEKSRTFPYASFGDSSALHVGDRIFAMGSPLAFSQSVTMGVVSNLALTMPEIFGNEALTLDGEDVGSLVRWIGHDAQIFPGNSGGPLVNSRGEIVGINEISVGLGGAIPGALARDVAVQLIKNGKVVRSWLGLSVQPMLRSLPVKHGALIADVESGSPADRGGLQPGDVLVKLADQPVDVQFKEEMPLFNQRIMRLPIGKPVAAVVMRNGTAKTITLVPEERQNAQEHVEEISEWGMCAFSNRARKEDPDSAGIRIVSVRNGGPTDRAKPALQDGDLIREVNGKPVATLAELRAVTAALMRDAKESVPAVVSYLRNSEGCLTVVTFGTAGRDDVGKEIRKAWLPISSQVLHADLAAALGLEDTTGVRVTQVYTGSAAETAGLRQGDIITAVDGMAVQATQPDDTEVLPALIRQYKIGSVVNLTILRNKKEQLIAVTLPEAPRLPRDMARYRDAHYELTVRDIAFNDRVRNEWPAELTGVMVESVTEGGWAALGRIQAGDMIYAIGGKPVASIKQFTELMAAFAKTRPRSIVVHVLREQRSLFVELQGSWPGEQ